MNLDLAGTELTYFNGLSTTEEKLDYLAEAMFKLIDNLRFVLNNLDQENMNQIEYAKRLRPNLEKANAERGQFGCPWGFIAAVQYCIDNGIIRGDGLLPPTVDNVRPQAYATRAEVAQMFQNRG